MKIVVVALVDEEPKKNMVQKEPFPIFIERIRDKYKKLLETKRVLLLTEQNLKS